MKLITLNEAEQDISKAILFYESQSNGLGQYFLEQIGEK